MAYSAQIQEDKSFQHPEISENNALRYVVQDYQNTTWQICEAYADVSIERSILESERPLITSSVKAFNVLSEYFVKEIETREVFVIAYLDKGNKINLIKKMFSGGIDSTCVDVRLIVSTALLTLSTGVIIAHNHPSGRTQPSTSDNNLTQKLKDALNFFEIKLLDHIIVTRNDFYSFKEEAVIL